MHAVILAAGQGIRLRPVVDDRPKGLVEIAGEPLVGRSVRLLRESGVRDISIVAGYRAEQYVQFCAQDGGLRLVTNKDYASTGSMASFAVALDAGVRSDMLLLESDIIYEPRALPTIIAAAGDAATLASGPTAAGDEVWVHAVDGWLRGMSKQKSNLPDAVGEFVGITRLSVAAAQAMGAEFTRFVAAHGHGRMDYETGALVSIARQRPVRVVLVPTLQWGEIDDEQQYGRVSAMSWP